MASDETFFLLRLFEKDPGLQNMFVEFREVKLEELARTRELHGHTERVMRAVENCVNAMDDPDSLRAYLTELGRRHVYRSAKPSVGNVSTTAHRHFVCACAKGIEFYEFGAICYFERAARGFLNGRSTLWKRSCRER